MADDLLQRLGQAAVGKLPLPLQRSMRDVTFRGETGPTQSIASGSQLGNLAGVIPGQNVVNVMDRAAFQKAPEQLAAHEGTHIWANNLPPKLQQRIPADNAGDPYNFGGLERLTALRKSGGTILDLPREQQAAMMQYRQSQGGDQAPANVRAAIDPYLNDMAKLPQSVILPTDPMQKGINTTPRAPMPPMQYAQQTYAKGQPAPGDDIDLSAGLEPAKGDDEIDLSAGLEQEKDAQDYPVTQKGSHFQGPTVQTEQSLPQDLKNLGIGALKGVGNTAYNVGSLFKSPIGPQFAKPDYLTPKDGAQQLGYGAEQAAEFFAPAGLEEKAASLLPKGLQTAGRIGAQALGAGAVNAAQGGSFKQGAEAGLLAGGLGSAAKAAAPAIAETALGVRNVDRNFARTPGQAILNDTRGIRPSTIAASAEGKIGSLTSRLEQAAAATPQMGTTQPAIDTIDQAIARKAAQNSPVLDDLQGLRGQLTTNRNNGLPLSTNQSATGLLNLKRGIGDTVGRWPIEQQKGVKGVARQVYGALDNQIDQLVPESDGLNQRISSLFPVANRANATELNATLTQRTLGRFARPTGVLGLAGIGAAAGGYEKGTPGAIAGGLAGAVLPEVIASPTLQMLAARGLNSTAVPVTRYVSGAASQLFRPQQK